jgi:hypothetical protein
MGEALMRRIAGAILVVMLGALAPMAGRADEEKPATPAEQYKILLKEFQAASGGGALSDEERLKFIGRVFKLRNRLALKFIELAEKYPNDPIAVDALIQAIWQVNTTPWPAELVGPDEASPRAFALLQRGHLQSDKLGPACQRLSYGFRKEYEPFLRAVLEKNPHHDVQPQGAIATRWNSSVTPTLYILDHKGIIRHKWVGSPGANAIDAALEKLIEEAEGE